MKLNNKLVSIIIPCYNDAQYIEQSVNSALNQTYLNKEVIVVDDGSNVETKAVLRKLEPKLTKLITQENQGQSNARNIGINEAKGDYILVLDSDDFFETTFCEKAMPVFESVKGVKLISSFVNKLIDGKIIDIFRSPGGDLSQFLTNNQATGGCMFLKSDYDRVNGYDESMRKGFEDWEFYIRLLKNGGCAYVIPEPLFNYRLRNDSTTTKANKIKFELLQYIYFKHQDLYKANYELFVKHLLIRIEREEMEKIKNTQRLEFKIGQVVLYPFRWIKSLVK
jgi:glycosyltransferase involved in cell wall biosynthesis